MRQHKQQLQEKGLKYNALPERRQIQVEFAGANTAQSIRPRSGSAAAAFQTTRSGRRHQHDEQLQHIEIERLGLEQQAVNQCRTVWPRIPATLNCG